MAPRVLIQKRGDEVVSVNAFAALVGFGERGAAVDYFTPATLNAEQLSPQTVVVGGVGAVLGAIDLLGLPRPSLPSIPPGLESYAKRITWLSDLGVVRARVDSGRPVFVKPRPEQLKQFPGQVVSSYGDLARTAHLAAEHPVSCSDVVDMASEYRAFVIRGEIVGCRHYWGDFRLAPDFGAVERFVADFAAAPAGYAADFAVTPEGETVLIEVNDGIGLGAYGLQPALYSRLLEERWNEIAQISA